MTAGRKSFAKHLNYDKQHIPGIGRWAGEASDSEPEGMPIGESLIRVPMPAHQPAHEGSTPSGPHKVLIKGM